MIEGFSGFGFPKAHGAAFGLLAYQSTWLRVHHPAEFLCALLNEQPMGFYVARHARPRRPAPRARGARPRRAAQRGRVHASTPDGAIRIGLAYVNGRARATRSEALVAARAERGGPVRLAGRARRAARGPAAAVARAPGVGGRVRRAHGRRPARGPVGAGRAAPSEARARARTQLALPLAAPRRPAAAPARRLGPDARRLRRHRPDHRRAPARPPAARPPRRGGHERRPRTRSPTAAASQVGGLVVARQRPGTANGIVFLLLEDETGRST